VKASSVYLVMVVIITDNSTTRMMSFTIVAMIEHIMTYTYILVFLRVVYDSGDTECYGYCNAYS